MKGPEYPLYILLISLVTADGLKVTMKEPLISVLRDENVTIPCEISDFTLGKTITVSWTKSQNGNSKDVYSFIPGRPQAFREGCYMEEESEIQRGNAALHIPRAQFSDDGEYTCTVIVTPESRDGKSILEVSVVPSAVLTPGDVVSVELGSEKVVLCDVSNFYPKDVTVRWVRHEKDSQCVALERGTCTGDTVTNPDGTFNVTSHLTLYPRPEDGGYKYSCLVKHRALPHDLMKNFTLTVTEREDNTGTIVGALVGTILATVLLLAGLLYHEVVKKDPPSLQEITGSDQLIDMTRTTLTFYVLNFKPNDLEICVCLRRRGEEMTTIYSWRSRDQDPSTPAMRYQDGGGSSVNVDVEQQSLMNGAVGHTERPLHLDMTVVVTPSRSGVLRFIRWQRLTTYSCQCSVHITPSYSEDNGAELSVHVSHPAQTGAVSTGKTLQVIGVAPTLLRIVRPEHVTHGEQTTLTCPIMGFRPRTLEVTWLKKGQEGQAKEIVAWKSTEKISSRIHEISEQEHEDKSNSSLSALMVRPSIREDDGATYICRAYHPATNKRAEQTMVMEVTAVPVLDPIKLTEETVHVGATMKLSCKIHSFYPKHIKVSWHTDDGRLLPCDISDSLSDQSGLYHATSSMTYTPTLKDRGRTFRCQVGHGSSEALKTATWTLEHLVSEPRVSDIRCSPPTPEFGSEVTLSCDVTELYPKDCTVQWFKGRAKMSSNLWKEPFREDPESETFRGTTELNFTADNTCHQENFRLELVHCGKTIEKKLRLILGASSGLPVLGDLLCEPSSPRYGQPVTLLCKVNNSDPQHIEVTWLKGEKPLEKRHGVPKQITERDGSISCSLQITATALDYGKPYSCSVTHKTSKMTLKKSHYLPLPDKAPTFSEITVRPERLVAGREATFTAIISGFTPDIRVKWYKDFNPFPSDVVATRDPEIGTDFLCRCSSSLRFTPRDSDHRASIRCEATHSVTKKVYEQLYSLRLSGRTSEHEEQSLARPAGPVRTRGIQCLPERPRVGESVTLTCYVEGCDVADSVFSWSKGIFAIEGEMKNTTEGSGSFSSVTFTAQETDRDCTITCEVTYNLQTQEEHFTLKLH